MIRLQNFVILSPRKNKNLSSYNKGVAKIAYFKCPPQIPSSDLMLFVQNAFKKLALMLNTKALTLTPKPDRSTWIPELRSLKVST